MKKTIVRTKNFVQRNKTTIVVGAIATGVIVLQHKGIQQLNEFLDDKGLSTEYYGGEED